MAEILLYGIIGEPADGLDAATITTAIRATSGPLSIRINSPGGYVMEGLAIIAALRAYQDPLTIYIDGLAASMASAIAMVGTSCVMAESAMLMVHKPWDSSIGNATDLRDDAAKLDRIEQQMVAIYAQRTNLPEGDIAAMLAAETWFDAEQALAAGFVTSIAGSLKLAAMARATGYGFRHLPDRLKENPMTDTTQAVLDERLRVSTIQSMIAKHRLPTDMGVQMIDRGLALPMAREMMLDALAARDDAMQIGHSFGNRNESLDNPAVHAKAIGDALYARMSGTQPEGPAREFMACSMVDMARALLEARGHGSARRMRPEEVLSAAAWNGGRKPQAQSGTWMAGGSVTHTTGDFPDLLTLSGQRFLQQTYQAAASPLKQLARERAANDFRPIFGLQLSNFGVLDNVNEAGEIKSGTFTERKETYSLRTFAKQFGLTRQAIINDDLGAFSDIMTIMGRAAAETEAQALAALLNSNPVMSDGKPVFDIAHNNYDVAGGVPSVANLDTGRLAMRMQKDPDGVTPIAAAPKFILSAPGEETAIEKLVSTPMTPNQVDNSNPFAGKLTPLVDPRLTGSAWYLFGDPSLAPVIEYANLNGATGPIVEMQQGWDVLGQSFRVYEDFGCGVVDWRGGYKFANAGQ